MSDGEGASLNISKHSRANHPNATKALEGMSPKMLDQVTHNARTHEHGGLFSAYDRHEGRLVEYRLTKNGEIHREHHN